MDYTFYDDAPMAKVGPAFDEIQFKNCIYFLRECRDFWFLIVNGNEEIIIKWKNLKEENNFLNKIYKNKNYYKSNSKSFNKFVAKYHQEIFQEYIVISGITLNPINFIFKFI